MVTTFNLIAKSFADREIPVEARHAAAGRIRNAFGMIWPPLAWRPWERRYVSNFLKSNSITPALHRRSLKKASEVASGMLFITPRPTSFSKERLSFSWNLSFHR